MNTRLTTVGEVTARVDSKPAIASNGTKRLRSASTTGVLDQEALGQDPVTSTSYDPSGWLTRLMLLPLGEVRRRDVFADLGPGKGRIVLQAAQSYRFKRVIGVEALA